MDKISGQIHSILAINLSKINSQTKTKVLQLKKT